MKPCLKSRINFDTAALEKIVHDPTWVLQNSEKFWSDYPAQKYTKQWADLVNHKINYKEWREKITKWAATPHDQRITHPLFKNTEKIIEGRELFLQKALPHLCSYLPDEADLTVGVYFTAWIPSRAFAVGETVINVAADYWKWNPDNILNVLVHELFHVGYSYCREKHQKPVTESPLHDALANIHNEGVCTYVAYMARSIFPAPDEKDFSYLDDPKLVQTHFTNVRDILSKAETIPPDEHEKLRWQVGVLGRSFYVTGAEMCRVIEQQAGRAALTRTLLDGPEAFFEQYNRLAPPEAKLLA